jgi:pimeloyl-ACP methyl ester carboxylesterase
VRRRLGLSLALALTLAGATAGQSAVPEAPAKERRAYVDGPWGQIHVRMMGPETGMPIILVHKMVWSSVEFSRALPFLARHGLRAIAVDLPGYGLSDGPEEEPTADQYADALLPVLDQLKIRQAVMLGTNTGATIVTAFALRHRDRTSAIILDGPPVFKGEVLKGLLAEPEFDRRGRPGGAEWTQRWHEVDAMAKGSLSPDAIQTGLLQFFTAGPHYLYGHQAIFKYPLETRLADVAVPVLLLTYPGDQLRSASVSLKTEYPRFSLAETPFPRMMADFQDPGPWADAVADYVQKLPR